MLKLALLAGLFAACLAFDCPNTSPLTRIGCFTQDTKVFSDMLLTNRDKGSVHFSGDSLDWNAFEASLEKLACRCAKKAQEGNYVAIALSYYGECHGTKDVNGFTTISKAPGSTECINHIYEKCNEKVDTKCIGKENAAYIYSFPQQAPPEINGGYSEWSEFTECSASCGEGEQIRERSCNNPLPENGGVGCEELGKPFETRSCKLEDCPVNGGYGNWSSYGECNKPCGSGSSMRTRKCDSPAPAHGGKPCEGQSSHSIACNTQPCLNASTCEWKTTDFDHNGGGEAIYLDRHSLHCEEGSVLSYMKLERNSDGGKIRYRYQCCRSQLTCTDSRTTNGQTHNGGSNGNTVFFDRQTIDCHNKGISYLKLDRTGDLWNYKYDCCQVSYDKSAVTCYDANTAFGDDGNGENIYFDRHTVECKNKSEFITYIKMIRNSGLDKIRFNYKCCSINKPAATN